MDSTFPWLPLMVDYHVNLATSPFCVSSPSHRIYLENVPLFCSIWAKVTDLMQLGEDGGLMSPAATCGCPFCLLKKEYWGCVDSKLESAPKIRTRMYSLLLSEITNTAELIDQIIKERQEYIIELEAKKQKPLTDDQKQRLIAASGVYTKDVTTKFGTSFLAASAMPAFHLEHEGITLSCVNFLVFDTLTSGFGMSVPRVRLPFVL